MNMWQTLITSLPTQNATVRQRAWRALKASGAAVLRDGVYLMPARESCRMTLEALASDVLRGGGTALVLRVEEPEGANFIELFDRSSDYAALLTEAAQARAALSVNTAQQAIKLAFKLRKSFAAIAAIDFFPGEPRHQTDAALRDLERAVARTLSPDEPHDVEGEVPLCAIEQFRRRVWATRTASLGRPTRQRLADPSLHRPRSPDLSGSRVPPTVRPMRWVSTSMARRSVMSAVASPSRCWWQASTCRSRAWCGSANSCTTLTSAACNRPRPAGVESVLAGLCDVAASDDELLTLAAGIFDGLLAAFGKQGPQA